MRDSVNGGISEADAAAYGDHLRSPERARASSCCTGTSCGGRSLVHAAATSSPAGG